MSPSANTIRIYGASDSLFGGGQIRWDVIEDIARAVNSGDLIHRLDLSGAVQFKPYVIALMVAACRKLGSPELSVVWPDSRDAIDHLARLRVAETLGVAGPKLQRRATHTPLLLPDNLSEGFSWNLVQSLEDELPRGLPAGASQEISNCIHEMIMNALTHSESSVGCVVVGQAFPQSDTLEASVLDLGITVKGHLSRRYPEIVDDETGILRAVEDGVTGTPSGCLNRFGEPNAGAGLSYVKEYIENTGGELAILSGDTLITFGEKHTVQPLGGYRFEGTLVNARFRTA